MPIYEYHCRNCHRRVSLFFRSIRAAEEGVACCPLCHSEELERLMSRVARLRSEDQRLADLTTPDLMTGLAQKDSRALAKFMRGMNDEMGEPMDAEMTGAIERWEEGVPLEQPAPERDENVPPPSQSAAESTNDAPSDD